MRGNYSSCSSCCFSTSLFSCHLAIISFWFRRIGSQFWATNVTLNCYYSLMPFTSICESYQFMRHTLDIGLPGDLISALEIQKIPGKPSVSVVSAVAQTNQELLASKDPGLREYARLMFEHKGVKRCKSDTPKHLI